jgi:hypothetical protein
MWVMLNRAFLSIVDPEERTDVLLVRGRVKGDIERVFPKAKVTDTPSRDYRFRALIPRELVAATMADEVRRIAYPNFKGSVLEKDRHDAYFRCWAAMHDLQGSRIAPARATRGQRALWPGDDFTR